MNYAECVLKQFLDSRQLEFSDYDKLRVMIALAALKRKLRDIQQKIIDIVNKRPRGLTRQWPSIFLVTLNIVC